MKSKETNISMIGSSKYVRIPYEVFNDSLFPFKDDDELILEINGDGVVLYKKKR